MNKLQKFVPYIACAITLVVILFFKNLEIAELEQELNELKNPKEPEVEWIVPDDETHLEPCPFCIEPAFIYKSEGSYFMECPSCSLVTPPHATLEEMIDYWNMSQY